MPDAAVRPPDATEFVIARAENRRADEVRAAATEFVIARAEGSASDEAHPSEENRRADERGHQ